MKLQKDLREFIEFLNSENVKYVIVGGYAVAFHGHPRFTGDLDVFIDRSEPNAQKMGEVIRQFGFGDTGLTVEDFLDPDSIVQLGFPPNRIDVITSIDGVTFQEAWDGKMHATLDGTGVYFISRDLLLKNKRAVGRPRDLADVDEIGGEVE